MGVLSKLETYIGAYELKEKTLHATRDEAGVYIITSKDKEVIKAILPATAPIMAKIKTCAKYLDEAEREAILGYINAYINDMERVLYGTTKEG